MGVNGPLGQITPGATATSGDLVNGMKNSGHDFHLLASFCATFLKKWHSNTHGRLKGFVLGIEYGIWIPASAGMTQIRHGSRIKSGMTGKIRKKCIGSGPTGGKNP